MIEDNLFASFLLMLMARKYNPFSVRPYRPRWRQPPGKNEYEIPGLDSENLTEGLQLNVGLNQANSCGIGHFCKLHQAWQTMECMSANAQHPERSQTGGRWPVRRSIGHRLVCCMICHVGDIDFRMGLSSKHFEMTETLVFGLFLDIHLIHFCTFLKNCPHIQFSGGLNGNDFSGLNAMKGISVCVNVKWIPSKNPFTYVHVLFAGYEKPVHQLSSPRSPDTLTPLWLYQA